MKNFIQPGDSLTVTAPYAVTSGQGVLVGALFGIAAYDAASSTTVEIQTEGVFDITKEPSLAITAGARVYWDNTNRRITTTATGNYQVGIATLAALAADTTARVWTERVPASGA
jgi:predicted RecA/RadA family phage recombinase